MISILEFKNYDMRDPETFPQETGKYLIRFFPTGKGEDHIPDYDIVWWLEDYKGFYWDPSCRKENNVELKFNKRIFGWAYLPNMANKSGKYFVKKNKTNLPGD